jgi:hypothetical protein
MPTALQKSCARSLGLAAKSKSNKTTNGRRRCRATRPASHNTLHRLQPQPEAGCNSVIVLTRRRRRWRTRAQARGCFSARKSGQPRAKTRAAASDTIRVGLVLCACEKSSAAGRSSRAPATYRARDVTCNNCYRIRTPHVNSRKHSTDGLASAERTSVARLLRSDASFTDRCTPRLATPQRLRP